MKQKLRHNTLDFIIQKTLALFWLNLTKPHSVGKNYILLVYRQYSLEKAIQIQ